MGSLTRPLVVSCGTARHHLRVALAAAGVAVVVARLPDPEDRTLLAVARIVDGPIDESAAALAGAIGDRRSDRRAFAAESAQPAQLRLLTDRAAAEDVRLVPVLSDEARARLATVLGEAARTERAAPGGDGPSDWLRAGEATSAAPLVATRIGLATTVLSQAAEVADTRRKLAEVVLGVPEHAQLVLRVGHAPDGAAALPPVPRRPLRAMLMRDEERARHLSPLHHG